MKILGRFEYHRYKIVFACNDEETDFNVTVKEGDNLTAYPFKDIRVARDKFEDRVYHALGHTSFTDVSIFMQQTNGIVG